MCGRYVQQARRDELVDRFEIADCLDDIEPTWNAAPGQDLPIIVGGPSGPVLCRAHWGFPRSWATRGELINAQWETAARKPTFRDHLHSRRCLVPAAGFYEWATGGGGKQPYFITSTDRSLLAFGGLWEPGDEPNRRRFVICTTAAVPAMRDIHARMPLTLPAADEAAFLDPGAAPDRFRPDDWSAMELRPVDRAVGKVSNDHPDLITAVREADEGPMGEQTSLF